MKMVLALVCSLVVSAPGFAQPAPANPTSADTEASKTPPPKAAPKAPIRIMLPTKAEQKAASKETDAAKKKDAAGNAGKAKTEEPKINGVVVPRGEKGFLGVEIVGSSFKITFYDKKKERVAPDVARAVLRWDPKYKVGQDRIVLNPDGDGKSLSNPRSIRPPHNFKLFITLIKEAAENEEPVGETHVIDFKA